MTYSQNCFVQSSFRLPSSMRYKTRISVTSSSESGAEANSYRITSTLTNNEERRFKEEKNEASECKGQSSFDDNVNKPSKPVCKSHSVHSNPVNGGKGPSPSRIPVLKKTTSLPATSMQPLVKDFKHRKAWPLAPFPPVFTPASPRTREQCEAYYHSWALNVAEGRDDDQRRTGPTLQLEQSF